MGNKIIKNKKIMKLQNFKKILIVFLFVLLLICAGCSNYDTEYNGKIVYSINSNIIHREKCGETHNINKENYRTSTKSVIELLNEGHEPCKVCLAYYLRQKKSIDELMKKIGINREVIDNFEKILMQEFGFWPFKEPNNKILQLLSDLYIGIYASKNDCYKANVEYNRIIASIIYRNDDSLYGKYDWAVTANLYTNKEQINKMLNTYYKELYNDPEMIYGKEYINHFIESVRQQHEMANLGKNSNDMAHLSATICAELNNNEKSISLEMYAKRYNGITDIKAHAGYIGDVCGTNSFNPSMNSSDYKADLDAVNVSHLYILNQNKTIYDIFSGYYDDIKRGKINRAKEFIKNVGEETLQNNRKLYENYLTNKYKDNDLKEYENRLNYFDNFYNHIINNEQIFTPCKYNKYKEYY